MTVSPQHDPNDLCIDKFKQYDEHLRDAPLRIAEVARHGEQIINLKSITDGVMDDIKQIKTSIDDIKKHASGMELQMAVNQADTKEAIKGVANEVKLWVVSGIVIGLLGLSGTIVASIGSFGNMNKNMGATVQQVNVDSRRLDILESVVQKRNSGDSPLIQSADYKKD